MINFTNRNRTKRDGKRIGDVVKSNFNGEDKIGKVIAYPQLETNSLEVHFYGDSESIQVTATSCEILIKVEEINIGWEMPVCEIEDYKPVAFFYRNGAVELDFLSEVKCDFLSEYGELAIEIEYPFVDSFSPSRDDFAALGFSIVVE